MAGWLLSRVYLRQMDKNLTWPANQSVCSGQKHHISSKQLIISLSYELRQAPSVGNGEWFCKPRARAFSLEIWRVKTVGRVYKFWFFFWLVEKNRGIFNQSKNK